MDRWRQLLFLIPCLLAQLFSQDARVLSPHKQLALVDCTNTKHKASVAVLATWFTSLALFKLPTD